MSTVDVATARVGQSRLLGSLAMAGGACYVIAWGILEQTSDEANAAANAFGTLWALGAMAGLVGIGILGVAGRGVLARVALVISILAFALAALDGLLVSTGISDESTLFFGIGRLGALIGMLLLGIAAVAARRWTGWRKFAPFAVHLALPIALLTSLVVDLEFGIIPFMGLAWVIIGYAVWSTSAE